ncbi:MAG: WYL domain-containing protein [Thiobacillus sp.]|nr:WYL domain-containing protein [Thiobacillus sp.]
MTPSAARACFEAILWKPAIRWHIRKIEILKPIHWINLRRNEIASVIPTRNVETAMRNGTGILGLNIEDDRQQRAGLYPDNRELLMDILKYGAEVEVVTPDALREAVKNQLDVAAGQYRQGNGAGPGFGPGQR